MTTLGALSLAFGAVALLVASEAIRVKSGPLSALALLLAVASLVMALIVRLGGAR